MSNNLFIQSLLITLVAFVGYMHCFWGSTMNNRPIIVAPLVGLVLGDLKTGIMVGATLELISWELFRLGQVIHLISLQVQ